MNEAPNTSNMDTQTPTQVPPVTTQPISSTPPTPPPPSSPTPAPAEHKNLTPVWLALGLIVVLAAALMFWRTAVGPTSNTIIPGVSGVQGIVSWNLPGDNSFGLYQNKLIEGEEITFEETTYTVMWNENTVFYTYADTSAIQNEEPTKTDVTALESDRNVVVVASSQSEDTITASEVHILPGYATLPATLRSGE